MTYRVERGFDAGERKYVRGDLIIDPAFPAGNLRALIAQRYISHADVPTSEAKPCVKCGHLEAAPKPVPAESDPKPKHAGRRA